MSAQATGWVFTHSPLTGVAFTIHLAIADSVNDQNDNEFWMKADRLAHKARTSRETVTRTIHQMLDLGLLVALDDGDLGRRKAMHQGRRLQMAMPVDVTRDHIDAGEPEEAMCAPVTSRCDEESHRDVTRDHILGTQALTQSGTQALTPVVPIAADRFDEFWGAYPKRVGKGAARRSWDKAVKAGVPPEQIVAAVEQYAAWLAAGAHPDVDFCPPAANPATWLNQQRWLDELPAHRVRANRESRTRGAIVGVVTGGGTPLSLKARMAALGREPQQAIGGPR